MLHLKFRISDNDDDNDDHNGDETTDNLEFRKFRLMLNNSLGEVLKWTLDSVTAASMPADAFLPSRFTQSTADLADPE